jgi:ribulose-phosphate 3-epimerase
MTKVAIYPSFLAIADRKQDWNSEIAQIEQFSAGIHYDIGDGDFVPSLMLDPDDITLVQTHLPIDVHLMVQKPSDYFSKILAFPSVQAVAFHVECQDDIHETIQYLRNAGKKIGLAILHTTPTDHLHPYLLEIDYVLVMTVKGGYSGTPFIPEVLEKITEIHHKNPELPILVDG